MEKVKIEKKKIVRNGEKVTVIRVDGDTNWQLVEKING
jgi:uncharacterized protein YgiM (DUF1202 family)